MYMCPLLGTLHVIMLQHGRTRKMRTCGSMHAACLMCLACIWHVSMWCCMDGSGDLIDQALRAR
jgi:hypothetical protein